MEELLEPELVDLVDDDEQHLVVLRRITSYNVCYTKLLRAGVGTHGLALGHKYRRVLFAEGTRAVV